MEKEKIGIRALDIQIAVCLCVCIISAYLCPYVQALSACTAVIICSQDKVKVSWNTGLTRLIITVIGGIVGMCVVVLDDLIQNTWIFVGMVFIGILITILICKIVKVPYISARIGCITFILVATVATGSYRITYGVYRILGTTYGILVTVAISWIFSLIMEREKKVIKVK